MGEKKGGDRLQEMPGGGAAGGARLVAYCEDHHTSIVQFSELVHNT